VVAAVVVAVASGGLGRLMNVPRLRAAAAVADVVIGCAGTGADTLVPS
jgi:phosphoribosylformimino-5-aminoimidazole carboxamide ribonucleotide (ProFAR) isomerase